VQDGVESPVEVLKDLAPGKEYNLRASVADGGTRKDISCRFTPQKNQNGKLQILTVDFLAGNCVIYER
jgi:hypothetical protein